MVTNKYLTPNFAEELGMKMGCTAERARMPDDEFVEDSLKSSPLYFETDERTYQGVCCVCFKKGCLGRCPNPSCGLLMHHTCVMPAKQGGQLQCPICRVEVRCGEEEKDSELPKWHEVEVGAPIGKRAKPRLSPEVHKATFPDNRWPTEEEAQLHGFQTTEDWYIYTRKLNAPVTDSKPKNFKADFVELRS